MKIKSSDEFTEIVMNDPSEIYNELLQHAEDMYELDGKIDKRNLSEQIEERLTYAYADQEPDVINSTAWELANMFMEELESKHETKKKADIDAQKDKGSRLSKSDKRVIDAFLRGHQDANDNLETDGKNLVGLKNGKLLSKWGEDGKVYVRESGEVYPRVYGYIFWETPENKFGGYLTGGSNMKHTAQKLGKGEVAVRIPFHMTRGELADYTPGGDKPVFDDEMIEAVYEYFHMTIKNLISGRIEVTNVVVLSKSNFNVTIEGNKATVLDLLTGSLSFSNSEANRLIKNFENKHTAQKGGSKKDRLLHNAMGDLDDSDIESLLIDNGIEFEAGEARDILFNAVVDGNIPLEEVLLAADSTFKGSKENDMKVKAQETLDKEPEFVNTKPASHKHIESITIKVIPDEGHDFMDQDFESEEQKKEFVKKLERGDITAVGIVVEAEVSIDRKDGQGNKYKRLHTFKSGGLWGIEIDNTETTDYFIEVAHEEMEDLKGILEDFGVDMTNFSEESEIAFGRMW